MTVTRENKIPTDVTGCSPHMLSVSMWQRTAVPVLRADTASLSDSFYLGGNLCNLILDRSSGAPAILGFSSFFIVICSQTSIEFIRSLVFSLRSWVGRNQSPVMWPVWLWYTASWQVLGGSLPLLSPAFRRSHFRRQVPVRPQRRDRS